MKKPQKKRQTRSNSGNLVASTEALKEAGPTTEEVAEIAVEVWKIQQRALTGTSGDRVIVACERAEDRLLRIGFKLESLVGEQYDTNLRARVLDHDPCHGPLIVGQCISPAVYYKGKLVREAEVVTKGGEQAS
jgi:hypothetical protein